MSWSERGNQVAVGTHNGYVTVWDVALNKQVNTKTLNSIQYTIYYYYDVIVWRSQSVAIVMAEEGASCRHAKHMHGNVICSHNVRKSSEHAANPLLVFQMRACVRICLVLISQQLLWRENVNKLCVFVDIAMNTNEMWSIAVKFEFTFSVFSRQNFIFVLFHSIY